MTDGADHVFPVDADQFDRFRIRIDDGVGLRIDDDDTDLHRFKDGAQAPAALFEFAGYVGEVEAGRGCGALGFLRFESTGHLLLLEQVE